MVKILKEKNKKFISIAKHIAIIMDGNGRWAQNKKKLVSAGHKAGAQRAEEIIKASLAYNVRYLTLFAFSTENWQRPKLEVNYLMKLLSFTLKNKISSFHDLGVKIKIIGSKQPLNFTLLKQITKAEQLTAANNRLQLNIALNYGGIWDIKQAFAKVLEEVAAGVLKPQDINIKHINTHISLAGSPDPDLLIRTSGEQRISNFLLWNLSHTELKFIPENWPDFTTAHYLSILKEYAAQQTHSSAAITPA